jgi:hypothetical protein
MINVNDVLIALIGSTIIVVPAYLLLKKLFGRILSTPKPGAVKQQANPLIQILPQFCLFFCFILILIGLWVFGNQLLQWLKTGVWLDMSVSATLTRNLSDTAFVNWLNYPQSWVGLSRLTKGILSYIPVSLAFVVTGFWILLVTSSRVDESEK